MTDRIEELQPQWNEIENRLDNATTQVIDAINNGTPAQIQKAATSCRAVLSDATHWARHEVYLNAKKS